MKIFKQVEDWKTALETLKKEGKTVGFVPTLGALHAGHASLVKRSQKKSDYTIVSIFLNPTQFNEKSDLDKYPKTYDADVALLESIDCDALYYPSVDEVYPNGFDARPDIDLNGLDKVMEGAFRPGHFDGVVQVVKRLLELVEPNQLYMGQKDFQQFSLIQYMIDYFKMPVELVVCPIKREPHGLAMSSRNERLPKQTREDAKLIYRTLNYIKRRMKTHSVQDCINYAMKRMHKNEFKPEYFSIVDGYTLQNVEDFSKHDYIVACTAVWAGDVRLIDNKILKKA